MIGETSTPIEIVLRNKQNTQDFWIKVLNGGQYDLIAKLLSPDYTFNGHPSPADGTAAWLKGLREAAPDTYFHLESMVGAGDSVAVRWTVSATAQGTKTMLTGENVLTFNADGLCVSNVQSMGTAEFAHVLSAPDGPT